MTKNRNRLNEPGHRLAHRLVGRQAIAVLLWSLVVFLYAGTHAMVSSLWGGAAVVIPNWILAQKAFRYGGASNARKIVRSFYWGQTVKMAVTIAILAVAFAIGKATPGPLLAAMVIGFLVQRSALLWLR